MKNIFKLIPFLIFVALFFIFPHATQAKVNAKLISTDGNDVTVSIALDSIEDIDGCNITTCKYWQMVFEKQEVYHTTTYHRYYSSDSFSVDELNARYTFHLPAGEYSGFTLQGYSTNDTGNCGWEDYSYICPDGKHIVADVLLGYRVINESSFITFVFTVENNPNTTPSPEPSITPEPILIGPQITIYTNVAPRVATTNSEVTYAYTVWNTAISQNQTLVDVTVNDDKCSPVMFVAGDVNNDGKLDEGENWEYSCVTTLTETTTNTSTASGYTDEVDPKLVSASMVTTAVVVPDQGLAGAVSAPEIELPSGVASGSENVSPEVPSLPETGFVPGGIYFSNTGLRRPFLHLIKTQDRSPLFSFGNWPVTYTYTITNLSEVPVANISVSDNVCAPVTYVSGDTNSNILLGPDEIWTYTCTTAHPVLTRSVASVLGRANTFTPIDIFITNPVLPSLGALILTAILILVLVLIVADSRLRREFSTQIRKYTRRLTRVLLRR